jgi:hypothetical protein
MKKRWIIMMTILVIFCVIGVFTPETAGMWEREAGKLDLKLVRRFYKEYFSNW